MKIIDVRDIEFSQQLKNIKPGDWFYISDPMRLFMRVSAANHAQVASVWSFIHSRIEIKTLDTYITPVGVSVEILR